MVLDERQYERIARHLDGEPVELTADEQAVAQEIRHGEAELAAMPQAQPPRRLMDRLRGQMLAAAPAQPRQRVIRVLLPAAAAVAAVIIAAVLWLAPWRPGEAPRAAAELPNMIATVYGSVDENIDLDVIADELEELEAGMVASLPAEPLDAEIETFQQSLEGFWLETDGWPNGS